MKKLKKILSGVAAVALAASSFMGLTTAQAAPETGTIKVNVPRPQVQDSVSAYSVMPIDLESGGAEDPTTKSVYKNMTLTAYQIFSYDTTTKVYTLDNAYNTFFGALSEINTKLTTDNDAGKVYISYDANGKLKVEKTAPTTGKYIEWTEALTGTSTNDLTLSFLDKVKTTNANISLIGTWLGTAIKGGKINPAEKTDSVKLADVDKENGYSGNVTTVEFEDLTPGYWIVLSDNEADGVAPISSIIKLATTADDTEVSIDGKLQTPKIEKTVTTAYNTDPTHNAGAGVGESVNYKVTFDLQDLKDYETFSFQFKDTLTNQTFDGKFTIDIVKDGGDSIGTVSIKKIENATSAADDLIAIFDGEGPEIGFTLDGAKFLELLAENDVTDVDIIITYSATIDAEAAGTDPATNEAHIIYNNDPKGNGTGDLDDKTTVYTYDVELNKKFYSGTEEITGTADMFSQVTFTLADVKLSKVTEKKLNCEDPTHDGDIADHEDSCYSDVAVKGSYVVDPNGTETTLTLSDDGKLKIHGLAPGTYTLTEATTVDGYAKGGPITIKVLPNGTTQILSYSENENGAAGTGVANNVTGDYKITFDLNNVTTSHDLPGSGGMGVWLFGIGGVLMLAGAAYVYTSRKRGQA